MKTNKWMYILSFVIDCKKSGLALNFCVEEKPKDPLPIKGQRKEMSGKRNTDAIVAKWRHHDGHKTCGRRL